MIMSKRALAALVGGAIALAGSATLPAVVDAKPRDGKCDEGEFCYYHNSDRQGAVSDFTESVGQYGEEQPTCYEFRGGGNGDRGCIKNDAAYVWNRTKQPATVFFNSDFAGESQTFGPGASGNLRSGIKNENASHRIGGGAPPAPARPSGPATPGWASPVPNGQRVSARMRYSDGRPHNAYDMPGNYTVKSACNGKVSRVIIKSRYANRNAYKVTGSSNYVWIKCDGDPVEMGYAHFWAREKPGWIRSGARVRAGQDLFRTGNQGNSSGQHLHFEVRRGGSKLNPSTFMRGKGVGNFPR